MISQIDSMMTSTMLYASSTPQHSKKWCDLLCASRGQKEEDSPASTPEFSPLQCGLGVMGGALERIGIRDIMGGDHSFNELHLLR